MNNIVYFVFGTALAIIITALVVFRKRLFPGKFGTDTLARVLSVVYCAIVFFSIMLPDSFALNLGRDIALDSGQQALAVLRWLMSAAFVILPVAAFTKRREFINIATFFCIPVSVASIVSYLRFLPHFVSPDGGGWNRLDWVSVEAKSFLMNPIFRIAVFSLCALLCIVIPLILACNNRSRFGFSGVKDFFGTLLILAGVVISCIPIYVPQYLIGYTDIIFDRFSPLHFAWIGYVALKIVVLYFIFRKKSDEVKYALVLTLALSVFMQYNSMFSALGVMNLERLPLQLCNIGSYLILLAVVTRNRKLFDFTFIVNAVGALIAILLPDVDGEGIGYLWNVHFIVEHTNVLVTPVLCLILGVFPAFDKMAFKHYFLGFTAYFVFVLALGTFLNGMSVGLGTDRYMVNYLFMFDGQVADEFIHGCGVLFDTTITFGKYTLYPMFQGIVFVVFNAVCAAVYGVVRGLTVARYNALHKKNAVPVTEGE